MDQTENTPQAPSHVGATLRAAREAQGLSQDDVSRQTRVPVRQLEQIEEGRLEKLPAVPYSAGFVKAYARVVGLDPTALAHQFRAEFDNANRSQPRISYEPYEPADPARLPPRLLAIVALVIAVVLIGGYAIFRSGWLTGESRSEQAQLAAGSDESQAAPTNAAAPGQPTPAATPAVPAGGPVRLTALQTVWLKISERDGATLFMGVLEQGKFYDVPATAADPVLRTGRPEALQASVGGKPVGPLGKAGRTASNVSLKADALAALPADGAAAVPTAVPAPATPQTATPSPAATDAGDTPSAFQGAAGGGNAAAPLG